MASLQYHLAAPRSRFVWGSAMWPALVCLAGIAAAAIGWVGYAASDDAAYYLGALRWLTNPPYAGDGHWSTRFPLILSLAGALAVFGKGPVAMAVTALGWYALFVVSVQGLGARIGGARVGWIAALLMATLPVVVTNATTVSCDLTEAVFLILGIRLIGDVAANDPARWKPWLAGLAFGTAILCRETTALALLGFAPLFAIGRPIPRRALLAMGLGCAGLLAGEAAFQYLMTGDPLHRWSLAFHHDSHIDRAANLEGNLLIHPAIDPLLVLLINDDFALLFWVTGAAIAARAWRTLDGGGRRRMVVLATLALATFVLVGALTTKLVLNPRYFMLPALAAAVLAAFWLDKLRPAARAVALVAILGANLAMLSVENAHPRWAAEALVAAARAHPGEAIVTDAETRHRALLPLGWAGLNDVAVGAPRRGVLYLSSTPELPVGARVIARYPSPPTFAGRLLAAVGLAGAVPGSLRRRLLAPNPEAVLTRID